MHMEARRMGDSLIVRLKGELDLHTAEAFRAFVREQLAASDGIRNLILDLRAVPFIDSSGVGAILGRYKEIREGRAGRLIAFGPRVPVRRVLAMSGLLRVMDVAETQQAALAIAKEGKRVP
ncbi:MAG: hypothetical protein DIU82_00565 [Bacillota bacterium]|nr:hypothetical protein [Bacillota bacterium]REJ37456.1 MAG: hypothetical protein DIU82_00565 [Bacillota bacterium]